MGVRHKLTLPNFFNMAGCESIYVQSRFICISKFKIPDLLGPDIYIPYSYEPVLDCPDLYIPDYYT